MTRTDLAGRSLVGLGSVAVAVSLIFSWVPGRSAWDAFSGLDILLFALALAGLVLTTVSASRSTLIPLLYARVVGTCVFVCVAYGVVELETGVLAGRVHLGALIAGLGAALMVGGASAGASDPRAIERAQP
jgi:hypothetical protein